MHNGYSTTTSESASLLRRTFMSLAASSVALTLPAVSNAQQFADPVTTSSLQSLLNAHAEAKDLARDLWDRAADIEENLYEPSAIPVRVRYSWLFSDRIDQETGEREKTPLYAYSEREIADVCMRERDVRLSMSYGGDVAWEQRAREACERRIFNLNAELSELQRAMDRLSQDCGLTAAEEAAEAASERRSQLAEAIGHFTPATLHEAALLAEWVSHVSLMVDRELLLGVLANIAKAGGQAAGPPLMAQAGRGAA